MPRYVILEHDHPALHWDLMLDAGVALQTWRLASVPRPGVAIEATPLADHRRMYLDYEGPVSGDRGAVRRCDAGTFDEAEGSTPDLRVFLVNGQIVRGVVRLTKIASDRWQFEWVAGMPFQPPGRAGETSETSP